MISQRLGASGATGYDLALDSAPAALDDPIAVAEPPLRPGTGRLRIVRSGARSVVTRAFASSPLRLLTPRNHGDAAWVFTSTFGGGLVDGDALELSIDVGPGAKTLLATQAATKVYRSLGDFGGTSLDLSAAIGDDALLVVAPDPVVCFAGARYRQHQSFDLYGSAGLVYVDWLTSGRRASGERWQFARYASRMTVRRDGRLGVLDALTLGPDEGDLPVRMGRFDTVCVVAIAGRSLASYAAQLVSDVSALPVARRADMVIGASSVSEGCLVKIAATSVEAVGRAVRQYLTFVPTLLGDDPWARKW